MTMPQMKPDEAPALRLSRTFKARRKRVFEAFTDASRLQKWWGPKGMTVPVCELQPTPGGAWRTTMRGEDGTEYTVSGVYREIDPPSRLVFTWAWTQDDGRRGHETLVTLEFFDQGETTELVLTHEGFQDDEARDKHQGGWSSCFDCLGESLADGSV